MYQGGELVLHLSAAEKVGAVHGAFLVAGLAYGGVQPIRAPMAASACLRAR